MEIKQQKTHTKILVLFVILIIIFCVFLEGFLRRIIVESITPDTQEKYDIQLFLKDKDNEENTVNGIIMGPEAFIEPFAISFTILIEICIALFISYVLLHCWYHIADQSLFSLEWLKRLLNISKGLFLLGIAFSTTYVTFANSNQFVHYYDNIKHVSLWQNVILALYSKKECIYAFTQISGVFWIPFEYCIEKENAILQKGMEAERKDQISKIENRIKEQKNFVENRIEEQKNLVENRIKEQGNLINNLTSEITKIENRIKEQEIFIKNLTSDINENKGTISDDRNHGSVSQKSIKKKNRRQVKGRR